MLKSSNKIIYLSFSILFFLLSFYSLTNFWLHSEDVYFDENYFVENYFSNILSKDIVIWDFYIKRWFQGVIDNFFFPFSLSVYSHHFFRICTFLTSIFAACYLYKICNKINSNNYLNFFLVFAIFNLPAIIFFNFLSSGFTIFIVIIILIYIFQELNEKKKIDKINYFFYFLLFSICFGIYPFYCFIFLSLICIKTIFIKNFKDLQLYFFHFFGLFVVFFIINYLISNSLNIFVWKIMSNNAPYPNFNHALYNGDLSDVSNIIYKIKRYILEWLPNETNFWNIYISDFVSIISISLIIILFIRAIILEKKNLNLFFFKIFIFVICYSTPIFAWILIKSDIHSFRLIFPSQLTLFIFLFFIFYINNFFQFKLFKYLIFLVITTIFLNSFLIVKKQVLLNLKELDFIEKNSEGQFSHIHFKLRKFDGKNVDGGKFYYSEFFMPATFRWSELDRFTRYSFHKRNKKFIFHDCSSTSFKDNIIVDIQKCYKNSKFREVLITFESPQLINQKKFNVRQRWHIYKKENINIHKQKKDYLFLNLGEIQ